MAALGSHIRKAIALKKGDTGWVFGGALRNACRFRLQCSASYALNEIDVAVMPGPGVWKISPVQPQGVDVDRFCQESLQKITWTWVNLQRAEPLMRFGFEVNDRDFFDLQSWMPCLSGLFPPMFSRETEDFCLKPGVKDASGAYLLDRSPKYFEPLLNYLRTGNLVLDQSINPRGVLEEAKYFGIESLIPLLEAMQPVAVPKDQQPLTRRDVVEALIQSPCTSPLRFQGVNLAGADLSRLDLRYINFKYACLKNSKLTEANLSYACFERADLSGADLESASLLGVKMLCANMEADLSGADLESASLLGVKMLCANMEGANLRKCSFCDPSGTASNLEGVNLKGANLENSDMEHINLRVAKLRNANGVNLAGADLSRLDLRYINFKYACLKNSKLTEANLSYACFERADLSGADLESASLLGVKMLCANMEGANLRKCSFCDPSGTASNLEGVNLKGANLENSDMEHINLRVAKLRNANVRNCDLRGACLAG
ncbi:unnamed protein product, partial [Notodromas monacha]